MGARQSKRSVDITTTPKKEGIPAEGAVVGDAAAPGDGKLERIEETDTKPTTNGIAPHTEAVEDKEKDKDEATEKEEQQEEVKVEEAKQESTEESPAEVAEVTTPTEATPASPNAVASSDSKETKKKDKKKKWSFRSISFSKKDKTKPSREETRKNGDVTMDGNMSVQEPLAEGGEEAESATAAASSPVEEKSAASSPSADEQVAAPVAAAAASTTESKEEAAAASPATAVSPVEEKKEEPTPSAPTPVPSAEDKKEEAIEKVEAVEKKVVEVSPAVGRSITDPVEVPVFRVQPVMTPSSIIEKKTSEDLPSLVPSSPPPTPIDPSPLQQARQAAASATALAEALKLPAKAANEENSTTAPSDTFPLPRADVPQENRIEPVPTIVSPRSLIPSADSPLPADVTLVPVKVECPSVIEAKVESRDAAKEREALMSIHGERAEIDAKVERVLEKSAILEEVSERQEDGIDKVEETLLVTECDTTKRLDESFDDKNTQNEFVVPSEAKCPIAIKEVDSLISNNVTKIYTYESLPMEENELKCTVLKPLDCSNVEIEMAKHEMKVSDIVAIDKVMNETSPDVEFQIKNEINSCESVMKTNVAPNAEYNEKVETSRTLPSTEIEINSVCPAIKQCSSSENFEIEKVKSSSDKTTQLVESAERLSDSDLLSIEKCMSVKMKESPKDDEVIKQPSERPIELEHDYAKNMSQEVKEEIIVSTVTQSESLVIPIKTELFINSEEGPLSVSDDVLVEAKMAVVIPEDDSVEELTDTTESVKVIPETDEEKIENEPESDTALPTEETLISEEMEDIFVPEDASVIEPLNDTKTVCVEYNLPPPPPLDTDINMSNSQPPELPSTVSAIEAESIPIKQEAIIVFSATIEAEPVITPLSRIEQIEEVENCPSRVSLSDRPCPLESSKPMCSTISEFSDPPTYLPSDDPFSVQTGMSQLIEPRVQAFSESVIANTHISSDDFIPVPEDASSLDDSLLRCSKAPVSHHQSPVSPKDPTEPLLPLSVNPNSQPDVNIAFDTVITTKDCQILSYDEDDRSKCESKTTGSVPLSEPTSYDHSDVESKDRLAAECLAKTECQEGALSCQLLITGLSTAAQEYHQSVPETEAPVENNVAHDSSTTENIDEAPKIAPPAIPTEAPASPPTAPAITEDVASVTKAIEEIDISDKAVAAAVNECNTNEIIAAAHHQNNINEYE